MWKDFPLFPEQASTLAHEVDAIFFFGVGIAVVFSSRIISTDVPLLLFWALALLAWLKLLPRADWRWAMVFDARVTGSARTAPLPGCSAMKVANAAEGAGNVGSAWR